MPQFTVSWQAGSCSSASFSIFSFNSSKPLKLPFWRIVISLSPLKSLTFPQHPVWVFKASLNGFSTDFLGCHSPLHMPSSWSICSTRLPRGHLPYPLSCYSLCLEFPLTSFCLAKVCWCFKIWLNYNIFLRTSQLKQTDLTIRYRVALILLSLLNGILLAGGEFLKFAIPSPKTVPDTQPWCSTEWNRILFQESYKGVGATILSRN